jgi:hypothetical protein
MVCSARNAEPGYALCSGILPRQLNSFVQHSSKKKAINEPKTFVTGFLAHTVIRMFVYLIIILGYGLSYRSDAVNFILGFFVVYTIFTFFEVMQFIRLTRNNKITR